MGTWQKRRTQSTISKHERQVITQEGVIQSHQTKNIRLDTRRARQTRKNAEQKNKQNEDENKNDTAQTHKADCVKDHTNRRFDKGTKDASKHRIRKQARCPRRWKHITVYSKHICTRSQKRGGSQVRIRRQHTREQHRLERGHTQ
jgi:hypothetical protein